MYIFDLEFKLNLLEMRIGLIEMLVENHGLNKRRHLKQSRLHQNPYMSHVCFSLGGVGSFQPRCVVSHALTANLKSI